MNLPFLFQMAGTALPNATLNPDPSQLPGSAELQNLTNGLGAWALIATVAGVVIGAVVWALGHYSQNYQLSYNGRRGLLVSGLAALLICGAGQIISFFVSKGGNI